MVTTISSYLFEDFNKCEEIYELLLYFAKRVDKIKEKRVKRRENCDDNNEFRGFGNGMPSLKKRSVSKGWCEE